MKNKIGDCLLLAILIMGFWLRISGIRDNHSFWSDEALVSSFARDIASGKSALMTGLKGISYEPLQTGITALSLKLFGVSEFSARLPSVVFGSFGIIFAYLIAVKLSSKSGGLLAAFLYGFSQLNLANSTQAKPYVILETLLLIIVYFMLRWQNSGSHNKKLTVIETALLVVATFTHSLGILFWIIFAIFFLLSNHTSIAKALRQNTYLIGGIAIIALFAVVFKTDQPLFSFIKNFTDRLQTSSDNSAYLKNLFLRQYGIFLIPALIAHVLVFKKNKPAMISIFAWALTLILLWNYHSTTHNIRYLVPLFGIIFVAFGVFWGKAGEWTAKKTKIRSFIYLPILIVIILYISGYKIVHRPQVYYSPNADFYGDVQVADYKDMFAQIRKKIPAYQHIAVFNDVIDSQRWYLPLKPADAYFKIGTYKPYRDPIDHRPVYGSLSDFIKEQAKYPKGILIVEDWQSILPEDIKQYAKKNLKLQIRVNSLPEAKNDPWPLEVYSWGL